MAGVGVQMRIRDLNRRRLLTAIAALPVVSRAGASRTLVAYFSRSGNTRVVAGLVQRSLGAELFEIQSKGRTT
jgi:hypothetical protein